jgi:DNA-binding transcriptional ArsR family regulator
MAELDEIIHQPVRLKIMAALKALPRSEAIEFVRLRALVEATEGNLGAHLTTLEKAGYVTLEKDFVGKKPRTRVGLTAGGRRAFDAYVDGLRLILGD